MAVHRFATEYRDAGLSIIPLKMDGSKKPAIPTWEPFKKRFANDAELSNWYIRPHGIGIVAGTVSGGLEVIDFDDGSLFEPWRKQVETIVCWLPIVETPSGGYHVFYRCAEIGSNCKIACDPSREKTTLIETRGEGGYVCGVGSPNGIHKLGLYIQAAGPVIPDIPTITPADRKELWRVARTFDKRPKHQLESLRNRLNGHVERHCDDQRPLDQRKESARRYVSKMEPAVSGCNGHGKAFAVASTLVGKFGLPFDDSFELFNEYNMRCNPQWNEKEVMHKLESALGGSR
ncbi:MAG TPA: bifunctional DNA primase/polymerase [Pirellula sp.]|nr:bifunctional DNA primase/polymerase [Pirellula sp.]